VPRSLTAILPSSLPWPAAAGAPLEPSKRRWLRPLIVTYFLSWLPGLGVLAYSAYVLYGVDDTCWASGSISMMALMVFGCMGILAGIA
jgi:hypothetical protein